MKNIKYIFCILQKLENSKCWLWICVTQFVTHKKKFFLSKKFQEILFSKTRCIIMKSKIKHFGKNKNVYYKNQLKFYK